MATTLNSVTIADPFEITIESSVLGTTKRSANGTILTDYVTTIMQKSIAMNWRLLTSTERNTLITQIELAIGTARTLVLPDGRSISVVFPADSKVSETEVRYAAGWYYNVSATFMENLRLS